MPAEYYERNASVGAIMVELNRRLYLDEVTGEKLAAFGEVGETTREVVVELLGA